MNDQTADREGLAEVLGAHVIARWSDHTYGCRSCANHYEQTADPFEMREYAALSKPDWTYEQAMDHLAAAILASPQFARIIAEAEARALRRVADEAEERGDIGKEGCDEAWTWLRIRAAQVAPDAGGEG